MNLDLIRVSTTSTAIIGKLTVDGVFECYTLENAACSIPALSYEVRLYDSPSHGKDTPLLMDVPARSYIEIHSANWPHELKGCIAPGVSHGPDYVNCSSVASEKLCGKIRTAIKSGDVVFIRLSSIVDK